MDEFYILECELVNWKIEGNNQIEAWKIKKLENIRIFHKGWNNIWRDKSWDFFIMKYLNDIFK